MEQKQSFNLSADFLGGFSSVFMNLVFVVIAVYVIVLILDFLRDKFINNKTSTENNDIVNLLIILRDCLNLR